MSWIIYALGATFALAVSDLMRKLGSNLNDPFLNNLVFQIGSITIAVVLWVLFSRKFEVNTQAVAYALIGGALVSLFTALFFKSLVLGPSVSIVVPIVRVGALLAVVLIGLMFFGEKFTWSFAIGMPLLLCGIYLVLLQK